jgi:hypothetical protein
MRKHTMVLICAAAVALWVMQSSTIARATSLQVDTVTLETENAGNGRANPYLSVAFKEPIPPGLSGTLLDLSTYSLEPEGGAPQAETVPAVQQAPVHPMSPFHFPGGTTKIVHIPIEGKPFEQAHFKLSGVQVGEDTLEPWEGEVIVTQPYDLARSTLDWATPFNGHALVGKFSYVHDSGSFVYVPHQPLRRSFIEIAGQRSLTVPEDVADAMDASRDSSEEVADFLTARYRVQQYDGVNNRISSHGLVARTTGTGRGLELVATWQPGAELVPAGRAFAGMELEAGYRRGDAEWENLTTPAPDRGNLVARAGVVGEWAPKLGSINLDLGRGLRFFVRERIWADYADNVSDGDPGVRVRDFTDSELFLNLSESARVFLRFERGSLPPDLSKRVRSLYVGIGEAF